LCAKLPFEKIVCVFIMSMDVLVHQEDVLREINNYMNTNVSSPKIAKKYRRTQMYIVHLRKLQVFTVESIKF